MLPYTGMKQSIPLVIGNWKLNPVTQADADALAAGVKKLRKKSETPYVGIAPTTLHIAGVQKKLGTSNIMLGVQNVSAYTAGAHTGEQSVAQLRDAALQFVVIGHSERRAGGVTDRDVKEKVDAVLAGKLTPVVCVGESKRDKNGEFFKFVEMQIKSFTKDLSAAELKKLVIAYEPIWAIGTGKTATPEDVKEMQLYIEKVLTKLYDRKTAQSVRLLYGGSVKPHNAALLHTEGGMKGFLVGGASLKAEDFIAITQAIV